MSDQLTPRTRVALEIVVPVYNEDRALPVCIDLLTKTLEQQCDLTWSILIAENGSIDRTQEVAEALAALHPGRVQVLRREQKGKGGALRAAWLRSTADVVAYTDVDL